MKQWLWPAAMAVLVAVFILVYYRAKKKWTSSNSELERLLRLQDQNYQLWKEQATTFTGYSSRMLELIFRLIAESVIRSIHENLEYSGFAFAEGNRVTLTFVVPASQYQKALMNNRFIREQLRLFNEDWPETWLPILDFEILEWKEERGTQQYAGHAASAAAALQ